MEIWKDVIVDREEKNKYKGLYQVSNYGNVKNLKRNKLLSLNAQKDGYVRVNLKKNKEQKSYAVHRLVALVFIYNIDNCKEINHKDENRLNNCVENLEWCTAKYNSNYGNRNKKISEWNKGIAHSRNGIKKIYKGRKVIDLITKKIYENSNQYAIEKGINYKTLNNNLRGERKKNNYNIMYYDEYLKLKGGD